MKKLSSRKIVFVGAGSMAEAILRGLIGKKTAEPDLIAVLNNSNIVRLIELRAQYGVNIAADPEARNEYIRNADILVLAMKPKDAAAAISDISPLVNADQLIISVIAGLSIQSIQTLFKQAIPAVRTMPNTSSTIGLGATGISFMPNLSEAHKQLALEMFNSTGIAVVVDEIHIDTVTGISGCGPAYVYYLMENMIAAGVAGGLPADVSRQLTVQTVLGAAAMIETTRMDPAELRKKVTSAGGATEAAIKVLDEYSFSEALLSAIARAANRSREMGISANIQNHTK